MHATQTNQSEPRPQGADRTNQYRDSHGAVQYRRIQSRWRKPAGNPSVERKRHDQLYFYVSAFLRLAERFWGLFCPSFVVTIAFVFSIAEGESPDNFERRDHEFDSPRSEV